MPAPTGNTNAEAWTPERTMSILHKIEQYADEDYIKTLSEALLKARCYKQLWSYWKKKWAMNWEIMDKIYLIEQTFIVKTEKAAMYREINPSACFFILRYNYGFGTKKNDELPAYMMAEFEEAEEAQAQPPPKIEKAMEAERDFSPRPTDDEEAARLRAEARRNPHLFTSKPPADREYVEVAEDLYMVA